MNLEQAARLQAWFDGEVSASECAEIEAMLDAEPEAREYLDALSRTREALNASHLRKVDTGAAWGDLLVELGRSDKRHAGKLLNFPQLTAVAAAVVVFGMALWIPFRNAGQPSAGDAGLESMVEMVETDLENATPVVYIDQPSGWTVVWVLEQELPGKS